MQLRENPIRVAIPFSKIPVGDGEGEFEALCNKKRDWVEGKIADLVPKWRKARGEVL